MTEFVKIVNISVKIWIKLISIFDICLFWIIMGALTSKTLFMLFVFSMLGVNQDAQALKIPLKNQKGHKVINHESGGIADRLLAQGHN